MGFRSWLASLLVPTQKWEPLPPLPAAPTPAPPEIEIFIPISLLIEAPDMSHRLTHCPETGKSLDGINIRNHAEHLWPARGLNSNDPKCAEAIKRKAALMAEADARDLDARKK
jgi:hypothetical protein